MTRRKKAPFRHSLLAIVALALATAFPAAAQRGVLRGKVVDAEGNPLEGVQVVIELQGGAGRKFTTTTKASGEFVRVGLSSASYSVTCTKDGYVPGLLELAISGSEPIDVGNIVLEKVPEGAITEKAREEAQKHLDAAMSASDKADYQATIESLKKFLETVPGSAEAHFNIAAAYEKLKDLDNAIASYQKAVELKPDFYDAYVAMGDIYGSRKQWQEGADQLEKALKLKPNEAQVLFNWGAYSANAGDPVKAQGAFEKLIQLDPKNAGVHYQLGVLLLSQAKNEEAIAAFEKYLELDPQGARAATVKEILSQIKKD
jgi:tetratricopeptide (TPR) repeat protein